MMLLTFLDAKNILLQRYRFADKVLKLRLGFVCFADRFTEFASDFELEHGQSNRKDFLPPCLKVAARVDEEESRKKEALKLKRCRFDGVGLKAKKIKGLHNEEEEGFTVEDVGEELDHPHSDWEAMAWPQKLRESSHSLGGLITEILTKYM
uniref:Uncharacterized protein n=1 Tax=Cannabis sativa TaxID=3483 RepID=A0A803QQI5_CANSA